MNAKSCLSTEKSASDSYNTLNYNDVYNEHNEKTKETLADGLYITNHIFHEDKTRERQVEIKNGFVLCGKHSFSQLSFFEMNKVINKV